MKHISKYELFESSNDLTEREERLFDLIGRNSDNWLKEMERFASKGKIEEFMEHYHIMGLIEKRSNQMASILSKAVKHDFFQDWVKSVEDQLPEDFKESVGVASDLKKLGF